MASEMDSKPASTSKNRQITTFSEVTEDNLQAMIELNKVLNPHRIRCFKVAVELMEKIGVNYFISDGTLLAAYRDGGKFIPHDTDTDISVMEDELCKIWQNRHLLPEGYRWLTKCDVTGEDWGEQCSKPFDPATKGAKRFTLYDTTDYVQLLESEFPQIRNFYWLPSTDVYTYAKVNGDPPLLKLNWAKGDRGIEHKRFHYDWIFPRKKYTFEGIECWGPRDPESWLKEFYGYIGRDVYYDTEEKTWKKRD